MSIRIKRPIDISLDREVLSDSIFTKQKKKKRKNVSSCGVPTLFDYVYKT